MPPSHLQQLYRLDQSSPKFPGNLTSVLREQDYSDCVANLQDDDLASLIKYLDDALNLLTTSPAFSTCLRELREICGHRRTIPQSYILPGSCSVATKWPTVSRGYCDMYEGTHDNSKVSVKRLRIHSKDRAEEAERAFRQEIVLWKHLKHANIIPLMGITVDPLQALSVWIPGKELSEYVGTHPRADHLSLLSDIADGLKYLHSNDVIHGDLKGPSILVDDTGHAFLTDFGLAEIVLDSGPAGSTRDGHAVRWAAPEILVRDCPVSRKSDIYSFAMVTIEAFTGQAPFFALAPTTAAVRILAGKRPPRPAHRCLTNELWKMIERCWNQDPQHRPDISEVVLCLQATTALMRDRSNPSDCQAPEDAATVQRVRERKFSTTIPLGALHTPTTPRVPPRAATYFRRGTGGNGRPSRRVRKDHGWTTPNLSLLVLEVNGAGMLHKTVIRMKSRTLNFGPSVPLASQLRRSQTGIPGRQRPRDRTNVTTGRVSARSVTSWSPAEAFSAGVGDDRLIGEPG